MGSLIVATTLRKMLVLQPLTLNTQEEVGAHDFPQSFQESKCNSHVKPKLMFYYAPPFLFPLLPFFPPPSSCLAFSGGREE